MINEKRTILLYLAFEEFCQQLQVEFDGIPDLNEFTDIDVSNAKKELIIDSLLEEGDSEFVTIIGKMFNEPNH